MLIEKRASIDIRENHCGNTPFTMAAGVGLTDICMILLELGCDRNATNLNGQGALQKAYNCSMSLARALTELGVPMADGVSGRTRKLGSVGPSRMDRIANGNADPRTRDHVAEQQKRSWYNWQSWNNLRNCKFPG